MLTYSLSIFLTRTAYVFTNETYGIPLSRYTVFLQNRPLGHEPNDLPFVLVEVAGPPSIARETPACAYEILPYILLGAS